MKRNLVPSLSPSDVAAVDVVGAGGSGNSTGSYYSIKDCDKIWHRLLSMLPICPICLERVKNPYSLCQQQHNACHVCWEKLLMYENKKSRTPKCPTCRLDTLFLPFPNHPLRVMIDQIETILEECLPIKKQDLITIPIQCLLDHPNAVTRKKEELSSCPQVQNWMRAYGVSTSQDFMSEILVECVVTDIEYLDQCYVVIPRICYPPLDRFPPDYYTETRTAPAHSTDSVYRKRCMNYHKSWTFSIPFHDSRIEKIAPDRHWTSLPVLMQERWIHFLENDFSLKEFHTGQVLWNSTGNGNDTYVLIGYETVLCQESTRIVREAIWYSTECYYFFPLYMRKNIELLALIIHPPEAYPACTHSPHPIRASVVDLTASDHDEEGFEMSLSSSSDSELTSEEEKEQDENDL